MEKFIQGMFGVLSLVLIAVLLFVPLAATVYLKYHWQSDSCIKYVRSLNGYSCHLYFFCGGKN